MNYKTFKDSEFFNFFNLRLKTSDELNSELTELHFKPGGFQDHIDLFLDLNNEDEIREGRLLLDRKWIGDDKSINPFGTDISKSFIDLLFPNAHQPEFKKHLVHYLFNLRGDNQVHIPLHKAFQGFEDSAPEVKPFLDVYRGQSERNSKSTQNFVFTMENLQSHGKDRLLIKLSYS